MARNRFQHASKVRSCRTRRDRRADVAFFGEHGWIVVPTPSIPADLVDLEAKCQKIIDHKESMAFDWAWEEGKARDGARVQDPPVEPVDVLAAEFATAPFRLWAVEFASALMGRPLEFWYDQFLAKPPGNSVPTRWHQDEGYWGRNLDDRGITCWMPFHDVDASNGCMHFIDGGHRDGVLEHRNPADIAERPARVRARRVAGRGLPDRRSGRHVPPQQEPHMTPANVSDSWRRILTQHLRVVGAEGEGDHYPWKVYVNQATGERIVPETPMTRPGRRAGRARRWPRAHAALAHVVREVRPRPSRFEGVRPALELLLAVPGRVVVTGLGKSGPRRRQAGRHAGEHGHARACSSTPPTRSTATPGWSAPTTCCSPSPSRATTAEVVRFAEVVRRPRRRGGRDDRAAAAASALCRLAAAVDRHRRRRARPIRSTSCRPRPPPSPLVGRRRARRGADGGPGLRARPTSTSTTPAAPSAPGSTARRTA